MLESNRTNEEIYEILENEIARLKILPGEVLSENSLCRRFSISRTPIRSVLQRLQQNGFVQIVPHKGTIVTPISLKPATQWIFQRLAVECMVLRDFINICTPADIARVRYTQEQLQKIAELKMPDLNAASLEAAMSMIAGTARSMGITVEE